MEVSKGDVVLVNFKQKRRPAVVISSNSTKSEKVQVVPLTSNQSSSSKQSIQIKMNSAEGQQGGLRFDSTVDCSAFATIPKSKIVGKLGNLPDKTMEVIESNIHE